MSNDGWSSERIEIDGKQYVYKAGFPKIGDIVLYIRFNGHEIFKWLSDRHAPAPRVLLKPDPPRNPDADQFFSPGVVSGLDLPDCNADILRRQLESEKRAVELLRFYVETFGPGATHEAVAFLHARDEGLPWPEESP